MTQLIALLRAYQQNTLTKLTGPLTPAQTTTAVETLVAGLIEVATAVQTLQAQQAQQASSLTP